MQMSEKKMSYDTHDVLDKLIHHLVQCPQGHGFICSLCNSLPLMRTFEAHHGIARTEDKTTWLGSISGWRNTWCFGYEWRGVGSSGRVDRLHQPRVASFFAKEADNHILGIDQPRKELTVDGARRDNSPWLLLMGCVVMGRTTLVKNNCDDRQVKSTESLAWITVSHKPNVIGLKEPYRANIQGWKCGCSFRNILPWITFN